MPQSVSLYMNDLIVSLVLSCMWGLYLSESSWWRIMSCLLLGSWHITPYVASSTKHWSSHYSGVSWTSADVSCHSQWTSTALGGLSLCLSVSLSVTHMSAEHQQMSAVTHSGRLLLWEVCLSVCLSVSLSVCLSVCHSYVSRTSAGVSCHSQWTSTALGGLSLCLSVSLSVCLSVCLSLICQQNVSRCQLSLIFVIYVSATYECSQHEILLLAALAMKDWISFKWLHVRL